MDHRQAYDKLRAHHRETAVLGSVAALLGWDQRTMIPAAGQEARCEQVGEMERILHIRRTSPVIGDWLALVEGSELTGDALAPEAVNIREWRRAYDKAVKIPETLAVEIARAASRGECAWEAMRPGNDWEGFKPHLARILDLKLEQAACLGFASEPYDALLDDFEPHETAAGLRPLFAALKPRLLSLLDRIRGSARRPDASLLRRRYPQAQQEAFGRHVAAALGYDFSAGRLDTAVHPFSARIGPGDVRITTRYDETDFAGAFFSTVHETGHALYSQGLPADRFGEPAGEDLSLALHESQSRLWENFAARSRGFWRHFLPQAQARFAALEGVGLDDFVLAVNEVRPSLIRTEADEVTYNLHVMLRFDLELALTSRRLAVDELPEAWNAGMRELLGVVPPDHASGVMQDVHWSAGLFGYFPTYSLGNMLAAQFFHRFAGIVGDPEQSFASGGFAPLLAFVRENVHSQGGRFPARELVGRATGEPLTAERLADYLDEKFGRLYGV